MQVTQNVSRADIIAKLIEIEEMLERTASNGEGFKENLQDYDDWAGEIDSALRTLTEAVNYYLD